MLKRILRFFASFSSEFVGSGRPSGLSDQSAGSAHEDPWLFDDRRYSHLKHTRGLDEAPATYVAEPPRTLAKSLDTLHATLRQTSSAARRLDEAQQKLAKELYDRELAQPLFTGSDELFDRHPENVKAVLFSDPVDDEVLFEDADMDKDAVLWLASREKADPAIRSTLSSERYYRGALN